MISSSILIEGVLATIGFGEGVAEVSTDGPLIERVGVGVGLGFVRPDCAEVLTAKHAKSTKDRIKTLDIILRTSWIPKPPENMPEVRTTCVSGWSSRHTSINLTPANNSTTAKTRRSVIESNFLLPNVEPRKPPTTAAPIQIQTSVGKPFRPPLEY